MSKSSEDNEVSPQSWIFETGSKITDDIRNVLGGKGYQLAELAALRYPVPYFLVIKTSALNHFWMNNPDCLNQCNNLLAQAKVDDPDELEQLSSKIQAIFSEGSIPTDLMENISKYLYKFSNRTVAVRCSAVGEDGFLQSFAGMYDTYLNVSQSRIIDAIKNCWSSQFTARSLAYHSDRSLIEINKNNFAVIVQTMIPAEISGVCFTEEPGSTDKDRMLIEAVWGLGESLVGGEVSPDAYIFSKSNSALIENTVQEQTKMLINNPESGTQWESVTPHRAKQAKLQGQTLNELALICKDLEATFGYPCDIEWAIANNAIHILQCRPITKS